MAHEWSKDATIKIDDATGTLVAITSSVNNQSVQGVLSLLEDNSLADTDATFIPAMHHKTASLNGWVNSTIDGIFGPLVSDRTSIAKTLEIFNAESYYNGEVYPTNVQFSGSKDVLLTWSADLTITGAANRTSVALV